MPTPDDRIEELIAAAVAGELSPGESDELESLRSAHPWIDGEIEALSAVAGRLRSTDLAWIEADTAEALRDRILSEVPAQMRRGRRTGDAAAVASVAGRARARWVTPLVAAACVVVGLSIGLGTPALLTLPPTGPPGTLGAVEPVDVRDEVAGAQIDADVIAHTWGTEAVLDATGLEVGAAYSVVFVSADGREFSAGEMLGSQVPIHCRVNAAVLRGDAVRLEIRDEDARIVAMADLPEV